MEPQEENSVLFRYTLVWQKRALLDERDDRSYMVRVLELMGPYILIECSFTVKLYLNITVPFHCVALVPFCNFFFISPTVMIFCHL